MELSTVDLGMEMVLEGGIVRDAVVGGEGEGKSNFIVSISPEVFDIQRLRVEGI